MNLKQKLKDNKKVIRMVSDELGILQRGGFDMICPIVPPMQVRQRTQNQLTGAIQEQVGIQKNSCNTNCPLMEIGDTYVVLSGQASFMCGRENGVTGKMLLGYTASSATQLRVTLYDGTYPGANSAIIALYGSYYID